MVSDRLPDPVVRYFDHLESDEFAEAAEQFTEDCVYYHPPSYGEERVDGRESLYDYFANSRGPKDITHSVEKVVRSRDQVAFLGPQTGEDTGEDYFISFAELEGDKISWYMAGFLRGDTVINSY